MQILDRYASAVHATNLKTEAGTMHSNTDVLFAMGIAGKTLTEGRDSAGYPVKPAPLAVPLARLLSGDTNAAHEIVREMSSMLYAQSWVMRVKIKKTKCDDIAKACLAWHRNGSCKPCGGHGKTLIPGSRSFSGHECQVCAGIGKMPFERQFRQEHQELARWLVARIEEEMGRAGPEAMKSIASKMEF